MTAPVGRADSNLRGVQRNMRDLPSEIWEQVASHLHMKRQTDLPTMRALAGVSTAARLAADGFHYVPYRAPIEMSFGVCDELQSPPDTFRVGDLVYVR